MFSHRFQITTDVRVRRINNRLNGLNGFWVPSRGCSCLSCTNRASGAPTKKNESVKFDSSVVYITQAAMFSHRFQITTDVRVRRINNRLNGLNGFWVPSRGCSCLSCTNRASGAPTKKNESVKFDSSVVYITQAAMFSHRFQITTDVRVRRINNRLNGLSGFWVPSRGCSVLASV